jgi:uncharacterized protein (TIGR00725 family)
MATRSVIGVIGGGGELNQDLYQCAYDTGMLIAQRNAVLVCGGLGGVMEAACKGAAEHGGAVVGILPSHVKADANPYVTIAIPTGLGMARNVLVVNASDVIIAFPGAFGTLAETAMALDSGKSVIYLPGAWDLKKAGALEGKRFIEAFDARQAVGMALGEIGKAGRGL